MTTKNPHKVKVVIMGSGGVGKSAITVQYTSGLFLKKYDPTIEETYTKPVEVDAFHYMLEILDTAGTEQFTEMRDIYIKEGDGIVLVFSLVSDSTFLGISKIQEQIVKVKGDDVPLLLVGNKSDLENRQVKKEDAQGLADKITKGKYLEVSAKLNQNVNEIFIEMIRQIAIKHPPKKRDDRRSCAIL